MYYGRYLEHLNRPCLINSNRIKSHTCNDDEVKDRDDTCVGIMRLNPLLLLLNKI